MIIQFRRKPTHAYIGVKGGTVVMITADQADNRTAKDVAAHIADGGYIERVPIDKSEGMLGRVWRRPYCTAPLHRHPA